MLDLPASPLSNESWSPNLNVDKRLSARRGEVLAELANRQAVWFDDEIEKFDRWAEDQRHALRVDLKDLDAALKDMKNQARTAGALRDKLALQRKISDLESERDGAWRAYDESSRNVEATKGDLLDQVEARLATEITTEQLFAVQWEMV